MRMREVLARPWIGVCVHLALSLSCFKCLFHYKILLLLPDQFTVSYQQQSWDC